MHWIGGLLARRRLAIRHGLTWVTVLIAVAACGPETLPQRDADAARAWSFLIEQQSHRTEILTEIATRLAGQSETVFQTDQGSTTGRALGERFGRLAGLHAETIDAVGDPSRDAAVLERYGRDEQRYRDAMDADGQVLRNAASRFPALGPVVARLDAATGRVARAEQRFRKAVATFNTVRGTASGKLWASIMFFELTPRPTMDD